MKLSYTLQELQSLHHEQVKTILIRKAVSVTITSGVTFSKIVKSLGYNSDTPSFYDGIRFEDNTYLKFNDITRINLI